LGGRTPGSPSLRLSAAPRVARIRGAKTLSPNRIAVMQSNNHLRHGGGAPAAFVALLRFEADAYRLRAWLIHAYDLLESDRPLGADEIQLLKEDVGEAADLARKLINIYDDSVEHYSDPPSE
jgi:hypothetical protein